MTATGCMAIQHQNPFEEHTNRQATCHAVSGPCGTSRIPPTAAGPVHAGRCHQAAHQRFPCHAAVVQGQAQVASHAAATSSSQLLDNIKLAGQMMQKTQADEIAKLVLSSALAFQQTLKDIGDNVNAIKMSQDNADKAPQTQFKDVQDRVNLLLAIKDEELPIITKGVTSPLDAVRDMIKKVIELVTVVEPICPLRARCTVRPVFYRQYLQKC